MTIAVAFDAPRTSRPAWLVTLADLGLLLVGFFVFLQANQHLDRRALAAGMRAGFGAAASAPAPAAPDPMPVASAGMLNFASGSAALPGPADGLVAWARAVTRDPRVTLKVTGEVDGTPADVDPATGSGELLAADRARAVAAALAAAHVVAAGHLTIVAAPDRATGRRAVSVTLGFSGTEPQHRTQP